MALYSIIGTRYSGDGKNNFALPDLRGRVPMHAGVGPGLTYRELASTGGSESVTLTVAQLPAHNHVANCQTAGTSQSPVEHIWASGPGRPTIRQIYADSPDTTLHPASLSSAGGGQPHNNMQPYLGLNFIIALQGVFPPRP